MGNPASQRQRQRFEIIDLFIEYIIQESFFYKAGPKGSPLGGGMRGAS